MMLSPHPSVIVIENEQYIRIEWRDRTTGELVAVWYLPARTLWT